MSSYDYNNQQLMEQPLMQFPGQQQMDMSQLLIFQIKGKPAFAFADITLQPGQRIVTDGNVMLWQDGGIDEPDSVCWGGCCQGMCRMLANEDVCMNTFKNDSDKPRNLAVGENDPGDMLSFAVTPEAGWVVNDNAFIAGTDNINIGARFIGCCAAMCANENLFLTKVSLKKGEQAGVFIAGGYGALVRHDIPAGAVLLVSQGLFFAAHEKTKIKMSIVGTTGCNCNTCCCPWFSIVMKFHGPTVVYTQSRDPKTWNPLKYQPHKRDTKKKGNRRS